MEFIIPTVKVIHVLVSTILIIIVLLQPGKGGDLGSVFGGGTSESVFGASGAVPFLTKLTRLFAVVFFITSLSLGYFSVQKIQSSVIKATPQVQENFNTETTDERLLTEPVDSDATDTLESGKGENETTSYESGESNPEGK